jgi:hypothetical protein
MHLRLPDKLTQCSVVLEGVAAVLPAVQLLHPQASERPVAEKCMQSKKCLMHGHCKLYGS